MKIPQEADHLHEIIANYPLALANRVIIDTTYNTLFILISIYFVLLHVVRFTSK